MGFQRASIEVSIGFGQVVELFIRLFLGYYRVGVLELCTRDSKSQALNLTPELLKPSKPQNTIET